MIPVLIGGRSPGAFVNQDTIFPEISAERVLNTSEEDLATSMNTQRTGNRLFKAFNRRHYTARILFFALTFAPILFTAREERADMLDNKATEAPTPPIPVSPIRNPPQVTPQMVSIPPIEIATGRVAATPRKPKYLAGEDPDFAKKCGWPVTLPPPLPGSILSDRRIVAYYGNPRSKGMGVLGQYPKEEMLRRLKEEVDRWEKADPTRIVQPALHLIAVVAQGEPGKAGKYRLVMPDNVITDVYSWAKEANAIMFIDIQTGLDDIRTLLPRFEWILKNPDVHLAIDPEFNLIKSGKRPGSKVGTYDAAEINFVSSFLQKIVSQHNLPPKILIIHRFTQNMVTNAKQIKYYPEVGIVMNMDGWGAPWLKRDTYRDYIVREPVQFTGFKLFYHNDTKKGDPLLTPQEILRLTPTPVYIQYQ
jgi:hypothetical protein